MKAFVFMLMVIIFCAALLGMHYLAYRPYGRVYSLNISIWKWVLIFLALSYFLSSLGVRFMPNAFMRFLYVVASVWMGLLLLLFATSAIYEVVHLIIKTDSKILLNSLLAIVTAASIFGVINAHRLTVKQFSIPMPGIDRPLTIVQLSDIHAGTVNRKSYLERIAKLVNEANPNLVFITGDMFDGSTKIDPDILSPLDSIKANVYFSIGNHEVYENLDEVRDTISYTKIKLLENEKTEDLGIQIVAVNDPQGRSPNTKLINILQDIGIDPDMPTILMYHPPQEWKSAREMGINLMLSGHTHKGQIIPFNLLVKPFFPYIYGLYEEDNKFLYTTSGTGTWGPPMRIGSNNEIVIISLLPSKA
jgi:predicted MPP superfamily phosphohydrolase